MWDRTSLYNLSTGLNAVGVTGNAYGDGAAMTRRVARQMLKNGRHARICAKFGAGGRSS
jgi:hypothetical protein